MKDKVAIDAEICDTVVGTDGKKTYYWMRHGGLPTGASLPAGYYTITAIVKYNQGHAAGQDDKDGQVSEHTIHVKVQ